MNPGTLLLQCYSNCQLKKTLGIVLPTFLEYYIFQRMGNSEKKEWANFTLVDLRRVIEEGE